MDIQTSSRVFLVPCMFVLIPLMRGEISLDFLYLDQIILFT